MPEPEEDDAPQDEGARPFWSGTISFGLVSVPVDLYAASRPRRAHLRMLAPQGAPLRREYFCPEDGEALGREDIVRGYTLPSGEVVTVTDEELEALAPEKSRDIDLRRFVPRAELDPLLFERGYFLGPSGESTKAYRLLAETMERTGRAGIATFVMRGKEQLVAIVADGGILRAEVLRFADEVRSPEDVGLPEPPAKVDAALKKELEAAAKKLTGEDLPVDALSDVETERLFALAREKRARDEDVVTVPEEEARKKGGAGDDVDLMHLIQKSLRGGDEGKKPARHPERPPRGRSKREKKRQQT